MREISLEELLEAGCHFGHQVTRQNPKARDYIFEARDNIHIIDLVKTKEELESAAQFVRDLAARGGSLVVVGTKRQARVIVETELKRAKEAGADNLLSVTNRWIGGILTNFSEVAKNYKKLQDLRSKLASEEERSKYTKREVGLWDKERQKLESFYGGLENMKGLPDALFIIDTHLEELAVKEATKTGITTVGIVDTNADPSVIKYPIPANDDAVGSLQLIISYIIDSWIEGRKEGIKSQEAAKKSQESVEENNESGIKNKGKVEEIKEEKKKTAKKKTETKSKKIRESKAKINP